MLNEAQVKRSHAVTIAGAAGLCVLALAIASVRTVHAQSAELRP
jgi:D-arabinose 1-dehydrogenase-like Zn-dependent alcohol dehydrogenase